jgi:hypothetical protein
MRVSKNFTHCGAWLLGHPCGMYFRTLTSLLHVRLRKGAVIAYVVADMISGDLLEILSAETWPKQKVYSVFHSINIQEL